MDYITYEDLLISLLNKVNRVTSAYRHGKQVPVEDMDSLVERQISVERLILEKGEKNGT